MVCNPQNRGRSKKTKGCTTLKSRGISLQWVATFKGTVPPWGHLTLSRGHPCVCVGGGGVLYTSYEG